MVKKRRNTKRKEQKNINGKPILSTNTSSSEPVINTPPIPTKTFASSVSITELVKQNDTKSTNNSSGNVFCHNSLPKRKQVTNYIPYDDRGNFVSKDAWELIYIEHLLEIYNIFLKHLVKIDLNFQKELDYNYFFDNFSHFIYGQSSGFISPYLPKPNKTIMKWYNNYYINYKNEINCK